MAHCGSYAENLSAVSAWLDRCPNLYVDIAARLGELGRQLYSARRFLTRYSDRVLFGTDSFCYTDPTDHPIYYRALETEDEYFDYGVVLDDDSLKNIYHRNAKRLLGIP